MTEPEPTQPEPADDPGHILAPDVWAAVVADHDFMDEAIAQSEADTSEVPDED